MPYIAPEMRHELDWYIDELAVALKYVSDNTKTDYRGTTFAGLLNYACTRLAIKALPCKRYWALALVAGVFDTMKSEWYRRCVQPYEERQIEKNGDVYTNEYL